MGALASDAVMFQVTGTPAPKGSMKAFARGGRAFMTNDNPTTRPWMQAVAWSAQEAMRGRAVLEGAVTMRVVFVFGRPAGHFGTGKRAGQLKASAPRWPAVKPDLSKLVRAVEDAINGLVWRDDARVVETVSTKEYALAGELPGARLVIAPMVGA